MTLHELSQLYYLNCEIERLEQHINELETAAQGTTQTFTGPTHCNGISDKVGKYSAKIVDCQSLIEKHKIQCLDELLKINKYIGSINDSLTRQIISLRYISGLSWNQVASKMGGGNTKDSVKKICYRYISKH